MKKKILIIFIFFAAFAVLTAAGLVWFKNEAKEAFVKLSNVKSPNDVYTVHLNNGQIYFGNIKLITADVIILEDTHILQTIQTQIAPLATSTNFQLQQVNNQQLVYGIAKRSEINKAMPTDNVLFIDRHNVLFWEKLSNNSDVIKLFEAEKGK